MKKIVKLTESDINRIIKNVLSENIYENTLYRDIMDIISSSNSSRKETIYILKYIIDEMETNERIRSRFNK